MSVDVTPFEIPLEFPGYRLSTGFGEFGRVASLLQLPDVIGDLLVVLGEFVDTDFPGPRLLHQIAKGDWDVQHVLDLADEGQRRLGQGG